MKAQKAVGKPPHIWSTGKQSSGAANALSHWTKHRSEFPELSNAKQYVEIAHGYSALARNGKPVKGFRIFKQGGDNMAVFDETTKTWSAFNKEGIPQTMYKPKPYDPVKNKGGYKTTLEDWLSEPGRGAEIK